MTDSRHTYGDHSIIFRVAESVCCVPAINDYTRIKKNKIILNSKFLKYFIVCFRA